MPTDTFFNLPEEKRERIVRIALEEFSTKTYTRASMNNIVNKAGISKGSMYQYFENKKELYFYLLELAGQKKLAYLSDKEVDWSDFFTGFRDLMLVGAEFDLHNPLLANLITKSVDSVVVDEVVDKTKQMSQDYMMTLITMGKEMGAIRQDIPEDLIAFFINASGTEIGKYIAKQADINVLELLAEDNREKLLQVDLESIITDFIELLKNGISERY